MREAVIDPAALEKLRDVIGGDPEDLAELIDEFHAVTPEVLAAMKSAADANDLEALRISAHSLKSNGRDFGAVALASSCETLERDCRNGSVEDPVGRVSLIGNQLEEARAALRETTASIE